VGRCCGTRPSRADMGPKLADGGELQARQPRSKCRRCLGRSHHGDDLEVDEITPASHPLFQELRIAALHDLEAALKVGGDPARQMAEPVRSEPALIAETPVDGNCIASTVAPDDHVQPVGTPSHSSLRSARPEGSVAELQTRSRTPTLKEVSVDRRWVHNPRRERVLPSTRQA
jgi:hypothetical protein